MNKSWKLLDKILSGEKTIESRRYKTRRDPWNKISIGDTIFFKDAGSPITAKAEVSQVLQYDHLTEEQRAEIICQYGGKGKICFLSAPDEVAAWTRDKSYCILIFLSHPQKIPPFEIDKTGFGNACAWLCVRDIHQIMLKNP